jgi:hypothetical protein
MSEPTYGAGPAPENGPGYNPPGYGPGQPAYSAPRRAPSLPVPAAGVPLILSIIGLVCIGAGVLAFIFTLAADYGSGAGKFASALGALTTGVAFGGINLGLSAWLDRPTRG